MLISQIKTNINVGILIGILVLVPVCSGDDMNGPWVSDRSEIKDYQVNADDVPFSALPVFFLIRVYQFTASPEASRGCPSYPSCSKYMQVCLAQYGFPTGLLLGMERLIHEGDEILFGTQIYYEDRYLVYDPPSNNTFWWEQ